MFKKLGIISIALFLAAGCEPDGGGGGVNGALDEYNASSEAAAEAACECMLDQWQYSSTEVCVSETHTDRELSSCEQNAASCDSSTFSAQINCEASAHDNFVACLSSCQDSGADAQSLYDSCASDRQAAVSTCRSSNTSQKLDQAFAECAGGADSPSCYGEPIGNNNGSNDAGDPDVCQGAGCSGDAGCSDGETNCGGQCVDTYTSDIHCGTCGNTCGSGAECVSGGCACVEEGETLCGDGCVDTQTSNAHCGECGNACGDGANCLEGACIAPHVSAGRWHTCFLKPDASVVCWGADFPPEMSQYHAYEQETSPAGRFTQVSAGLEHNCGLKLDGSVVCWGNDDVGQATPPAGTFAQVDAGVHHSCGLKPDGSVVCWGSDSGSIPTGTFTEVKTGDWAQACGLKTDGSIACWGNAPTPPSGSFAQVTQGGASFFCGLETGGSANCWGGGRGGAGTPPAGTFTKLTAGSFHGCGLRPDSSVDCWGAEIDPDEQGRYVGNHGQARPPGGTFTQVSAGGEHTCGLRPDGRVECWGSDVYGQSSVPSGL